MSYTGVLQPGVELGDKANGKTALESPYSSFAISIDTRNIESSHIPPADKSARKPKSALKHHYKSRSASEEIQPPSLSRYAYNEKQLGGLLASRDDGKHSVRFGAMPGNHHRRSSTAAFLEYINRHLPENSRHQPPMLTLKRAFLMFCIVFSATYLAMSLLPGSAIWRKEVRHPGAYMIKRGAGYYGNSDIFQSGEVIADQADEHSLYLMHVRQPTKNGKTDKMPAIASPKVIPGEIEPVATQDLHLPAVKGSHAAVDATIETSQHTQANFDADSPAFKRPKTLADDVPRQVEQPFSEFKTLSDDEEDAEIEKKIAELKHRQASRLRSAKKVGPARQVAEKEGAANLEKDEIQELVTEPQAAVKHQPKVGKDALRKVAAMRRKDSAYDTPLRVQ